MNRLLSSHIFMALVIAVTGAVSAAQADQRYETLESSLIEVAEAGVPESQRLERDRVLEGFGLHPLYTGPFGCEFLRLACERLESACEKRREYWTKRWWELYGTKPPSSIPAPGTICEEAALCFVDYFELCARD